MQLVSEVQTFGICECSFEQFLLKKTHNSVEIQHAPKTFYPFPEHYLQERFPKIQAQCTFFFHCVWPLGMHF